MFVTGCRVFGDTRVPKGRVFGDTRVPKGRVIGDTRVPKGRVFGETLEFGTGTLGFDGLF